MKNVYFKLLIIISVITFTVLSCQKEEDLSIPLNNERYILPLLSDAKSHFEKNNKMPIIDNGNTAIDFRTEAVTTTIKWDKSEAKKYKDETLDIPQQVDILYTPIELNTEGNAKMFLASIDDNGAVDSKYVFIIYTISENPKLFSGYVFIYDLDGNLENLYKYQEGNKVSIGSNSRMAQRTEGDRGGFTLGELLDFIGGDWFGLAGYIENDLVNVYWPEFTDVEDSVGGIDNDSSWFNPINIPISSNNGGGSGGNDNGDNDSNNIDWWQPTIIFAHGLSISNAIEVDLSSIEANWLINTATQDQLNAVADYLNNVNQTEADGYNQSDIDFVMDSIWFQINNPNSTLTSDVSIDSTSALHFDSYEDFNEYLNNEIRNFNFNSSGGISTNPPSTTAHFNYWIGNLISMNIYVKQQNLGNENLGDVSNYEVTDVVSSITGVTFAVTWEQLSFSYNTSEFSALQNAVTDISGDLTVHFMIDGWGQIYTERLHGRVMTDMQTGNAEEY